MSNKESRAPNRATSSMRMSPSSPAPADCSPVARLEWDAFMSRTRALLQSRSPKVRTQNLSIDVPAMAANPRVNSEQRTELLLALIDAYSLYRDLPSRLLLQNSADTILSFEAQKSSNGLVKSELVKEVVAILGEKVDEFGEALSKQRGERRMCARLHELTCMVLRRVMQTDTEAALRESNNWKPLMLVHTRLCDLIFGAEMRGKLIFFWDQLHLNAAFTAVLTICSDYEKIPLLFETLGELAARLSTPAPALAALEWPIDACLLLRVGKEQGDDKHGDVGSKYLHDYKEYLLKLFVKHVVGSKTPLPIRFVRVFYGLLHTEVSAADMEQLVFPVMDEMYAKFNEHVLRVAAFLAGEASCPSLKGWYSPIQKSKQKFGFRLRRDITALGDMRRIIASHFFKKIYPSVISTDPGTRDAAFGLLGELQLSRGEKFEVSSSVVQNVHLESLTQPGQRECLYALLGRLPMSVEAIEALSGFILVENHLEPLRSAVRSLLNMFKALSQEADLPHNVAPAFLTKLRSSNFSLRLVALSNIADDSCSCVIGSVVPRSKKDRPRTALFERLYPAIEACLELGSKNAHLSSDAALEACIAMRILLWVPEENCNESILLALRSNPKLQCPLKTKPQPSFLLDQRTAKRMHEIVPAQRGFTIKPDALCRTLYDVLRRDGADALHEHSVKNLVFQQIREQMRLQFSIRSFSVEQFTGLLKHYKPMLAVELFNYIVWSFKETNEFSRLYLPWFSAAVIDYHGGYVDWLPQMIVSAHISGESDPKNETFKLICLTERVDPHEQISTRVDEYLAEIDKAARDPVRAEAADAAYRTVLRLAPDAVRSRVNSRL